MPGSPPERPGSSPDRPGVVVPTGAEVTVRVPATSANLGPGFDCVGLALGIWDEVQVQIGDPPGSSIDVHGEGADDLDRGADHLVLVGVREGLRAAAAHVEAGIHLVCRNAIPHGRGLGSSASAVVAGLAAGRALAALGAPPTASPTDDDLLALAVTIEGHPDNAAAALLGGLTLAWTQDGRPRARRLTPHPELAVVVAVPEHRLATRHARSVLPSAVPHEHAATNAARAALLIVAATADPDLLLPATEDLLHQQQRGAVLPDTLHVLHRLRADGWAAVVSGAGPSLLVLTCRRRWPAAREAVERIVRSGWRVWCPPLASGASVSPG
ncbi:MAG: homoserine kinase [Angustibacter sp.]